MGFEIADGAFGYVAVMVIRWYKLESAVSIFNDGATILSAGLVFEDLDINTMAFGLEERHDAVVGRNVMTVVV